MTGETWYRNGGRGRRWYHASVEHNQAWVVTFTFEKINGSLILTDVAFHHKGVSAFSAESMRRLPLGALLAEARGLLSERYSPLRDFDTMALLRPFIERGRRGTTRRPDSDYAGLAALYVGLVEKGDRTPAKTIHARFGCGSAAVWSNRIGVARKRGLLTKATRGESGGRLTRKARRLLEPA